MNMRGLVYNLHFHFLALYNPCLLFAEFHFILELFHRYLPH